MPGGEGWGGPPLHRTPCSGRSEKFHVVHNLQFGICIQDPYLWRAPFWPPIKGLLVLLDLNVSCLLSRLSLQGLRQQLLSKLQTKLEVNNNFFRQSTFFENFWATAAGVAGGGELPLPWMEPLHREVGIWEYELSEYLKICLGGRWAFRIFENIWKYVLVDDKLSEYLRIFENMSWRTINFQVQKPGVWLGIGRQDLRDR